MDFPHEELIFQITEPLVSSTHHLTALPARLQTRAFLSASTTQSLGYHTAISRVCDIAFHFIRPNNNLHGRRPHSCMFFPSH